MAKTDYEKPTLLEFVYGPISFSNYYTYTHDGKKKYKYYDTPDGQDIWKKMGLATKYGLVFSSIFAYMDIRMYSNPKTVFETVNRVAWYVVPITGIFTTYTAITYTVTNLTGVDSPFNGGIGGAAAGGLVGVWMKNYRLGILAALYSFIGCTMAKDAHMLGHELFVIDRFAVPLSEGLRPRSHDWSLMPIGEKGWTTGA